MALLARALSLNSAHMERDLAGARLSPGDFRRLAAACQLDVHFPKDFQTWTALVDAGARALAEQGAQVSEIPLNVDDFVGWCQRVDVTPCLDALRAYLILIRRRQHIPGKSPTGPRAKPRASQRREPPKRGAFRSPTTSHGQVADDVPPQSCPVIPLSSPRARCDRSLTRLSKSCALS